MPITIKPYHALVHDKPKMYFVTIINDAYVPWEFCVRMLVKVFHMSVADAEIVSNEIVTDGEGFCGGYMLEIAETKAEIIEEQAKKEGYSLCCLIEEV